MLDFMLCILKQTEYIQQGQQGVFFNKFQGDLCRVSLDHEGDFHLVPNPELTFDLRRSFLQKPASADLVNICLQWYKRPPKSIAPEFLMQNDLGEVTKIRLKTAAVSATW
ncbi:DUF2026 family protein [Hydrogenophaga sp.]|uniref:DUF2026 family protein n=1 Tax=Hydrogenophaga sp. TaxID=1904254 RepID=UPI002736E4E5|nr:DUF2026 family protein [Hydrogenophaga sp.]MDP3326265.1 DUF2026 family protein [Hydrogenophaga sp.]MDP3883322.1 DUF2026 family protein [Hydrogenophaga sp.]